MSDFYKRLQDEQRELLARIEKLRCFIYDGSPIYSGLPTMDQHLLIEQLQAMTLYSGVLRSRLDRCCPD